MFIFMLMVLPKLMPFHGLIEAAQNRNKVQLMMGLGLFKNGLKKVYLMDLDELRNDIAKKQKKGLPLFFWYC